MLISPHRHVGGLLSSLRCAIHGCVTVFVNGLAYCEARLAGSGVGVQSIWTLDVTKPLCIGTDPCVVQVGEDDARIPVDLLKPSASPHDLRIVVGLPGY